jgi:murein DD-endopeptidase MepM/ murein hydrolase activator NlpD
MVLRPGHARALSYSIVASLAGLAIWYTPSLGAVRDIPLAPVVVVHPEMPQTDYTSSPMLVFAPTSAVVDTVAVAGIIHESLFASLDESAQEELPPSARHNLAYTLASIFEHKADLSRDLDDGDNYHVLVERLSQPNGRIIVNKVLGARLGLGGGQNVVEAVRFESKTSSAKYFDANGRSLTPSFLKVPVNFRRISSGFGNRFHPILGQWRHHDGTDYAAAMGTPVKTIGDGTIIFAGWKGGYGNTIEIRHRNGMVTRYGHMRNFAKGMRTGTGVKMGSVIGFVGSTGLSTGPHLHFEVLVGGHAENPRTALRSRTGDPVPFSERALFDETRRLTLTGLAQAKITTSKDNE